MPVQFCGNKPPYTPQPLCPCPSVRGWPIRTDLLDRLDAWMQSAVFIRRYRCHNLAQTAPQAAIECPVSWRLWTWLRALSFSQPQLAFIMKGCYGAAFNRFFVLCVCVCVCVRASVCWMKEWYIVIYTAVYLWPRRSPLWLPQWYTIKIMYVVVKNQEFI